MKTMIIFGFLLLTILAWGDTVPGVTDITVITHEGKKVELLTNIKGFTLYTFDPDGPDQSNCYDSCASAWPPILITADQVARVQGDFRVVKRKDGTLQLSFDSHPLYLYVGDKKAGDTNGDGLGGVWYLAVDEH